MESKQAIEMEPQEGTWGFYNLLPDELKLNVLKHAIPWHGAHHFTMKVPDRLPADDPNRRLVDREVLEIASPLRKDEDIQRDDSAWLGIWNLGWTVKMSQEEIVKDKHRKVLYQRDRSKFWFKKEEPNMARVSPYRDLIILRVASKDFEITNLDPAKNRKKFHDIKHVAFDFFNPEGKTPRGTPWSMGAFYCTCYLRPHRDLAICPKALCEFLRMFGKLREVFIIYPINKGRIDQKIQQGIDNRGQKRTRNGTMIEQTPKFVNKNADVLMEDTMDKFKGRTRIGNSHKKIKELTLLIDIAQKRNLAVFEDRKKVYCQVRKKDCRELKDHYNLWGIVSQFQRSWTRRRPVGDMISDAQWDAWAKVKVGVLVCRDRVGADPWKVNAILNNEIKPEDERAESP
ncbi:hypothetical protein PG993_009429 [Apiospora rasikravindrae]|uniref:Uncharacterized protein n=1 Tax=Apiospora rasikravindrae TaxID=990691 RepID=A0ABR1SJI9_9PEZI